MHHPNPRWGFPHGNMQRFPPRSPQQGGYPQRGPPPQRGPIPYGGPQRGPQQHGSPSQQRGPQQHGGPSQQRGPPPHGGTSPQRGPQPYGNQQYQRFPGQPLMGQQRPDMNQNRFGSPRPMAPPMGPRHPHGGFRGPPPPHPHHAPNSGQPNFNRNPGQFQGRPRFSSGQSPQGGQQKKQKVDKRDLPENNKYYCDCCDRGYKDEDKYQAHVQTHEKCPEPGCVYVAASKLVQMHVRLQHRSGLAKKIWSLETPEDIKKWRDERKKHYPTSENIAKQNAVNADKIARGEVIEEKYFGKMKGRGGRNNRGRGRGRGRSFGEREPNEENSSKRKMTDTKDADCTSEKQLKKDCDNTEEPETDALAVFFGATNSNSDSDSDQDDGVKRAATSTQPKLSAAGALGSLIASYSDSEADDEDTKKTVKEINDDGSKGSKHDNSRRKQNRTRGKKNKNKEKWQPHQKVDKSLLEKLLAKEIRQERNKILQCVHFIVKSDFFEDKEDKREHV